MKRITDLKRYNILLLFIILALVLTTQYVRADNGPKPELKIIIENPSKEEYYLDLLVDYEVDNGYSWLHEEEYNQEKIQIFKEFREDNWRPALLTKTRAPMKGELVGNRDGDKVIHDFGYTLPDRFKIAILTSDNKITVSDEVTLKAFKTTLVYDYENNKISYENEVDKNGIVKGTIIQMLSSGGILLTCGLTLLIEGLVLILFKFNLKRNIKPFILINIFTQVLLYMVLIFIINKYKFSVFSRTLITMEVLILFIESILFSKYLKEYTLKRRIAFSIIANITSFLSGYLIYILI